MMNEEDGQDGNKWRRLLHSRPPEGDETLQFTNVPSDGRPVTAVHRYMYTP